MPAAAALTLLYHKGGVYAGDRRDIAELKKRILLVDDERDIVFVLKTGLTRNGFDVDAFSNPRHALSYFEQGVYDLLILDVRMPGMSGIELYKEIQKKEPGIKVAFLTAFEIDDQEWRLMLPDVNIDSIIRKPVTMPDLVQKISRMAGG